MIADTTAITTIEDQFAALKDALSVQDVASGVTLSQAITERLSALYTAAEQAQSAELMTYASDAYTYLTQLTDSFGNLVSLTGTAMQVANTLFDERGNALEAQAAAEAELEDIREALSDEDEYHPELRRFAESVRDAAYDAAYDEAAEMAEESLNNRRDEISNDSYNEGFDAGWDAAQEDAPAQDEGAKRKMKDIHDAIANAIDGSRCWIRAEAFTDALIKDKLTDQQKAALNALLELFYEESL